MVSNLDDFCKRVSGFENMQSSEMIDYFSYYLITYCEDKHIKAKNIASCFSQLKIPPYSNISKYLSDNSKKVKAKTQKFIKSNEGYFLSRQRNEEIQRNVILDVPRIEVSKTLRELSDSLVNKSERIFLEEAIKTFEVEAYRASIIMVWLLTLDHLFEYILQNRIQDFITALRRANINKSIRSKDDFGDLKESQFIELCRSADIITNDVRKILEFKLGIRNSFAHPSTIHLPKSKALEFIEDLVLNVILKY